MIKYGVVFTTGFNTLAHILCKVVMCRNITIVHDIKNVIYFNQMCLLLFMNSEYN